MNQPVEFAFEIAPFVLSMFVELLSPVLHEFMRNSLDSDIDADFPPKQFPDAKKLIHDYIGLAYGGVSSISALIITMATAIAIPFLRAQPDLGFAIMLFMVAVLVFYFLYFGIANPSKHAARSIGPYDFPSVVTIALNIIFVYLYVIQWGLVRLSFAD